MMMMILIKKDRNAYERRAVEENNIKIFWDIITLRDH